MSTVVTFEIPGTPASWRPPRVVTLPDGRRIAHKEAAELQWKDQVRAAAMGANVNRHYSEGAVAIFVTVVYPRPASWPKTKRLERQPKTTIPDGDNLIKAIKDALQAIAVRNDSQFWFESIKRLWGTPGEPARVFIELQFEEDRMTENPF